MDKAERPPEQDREKARKFWDSYKTLVTGGLAHMDKAAESLAKCAMAAFARQELLEAAKIAADKSDKHLGLTRLVAKEIAAAIRAYAEGK